MLIVIMLTVDVLSIVILIVDLESDVTVDWFGLACFANKNKNCQLLYS
jgi:hypothetical protein